MARVRMVELFFLVAWAAGLWVFWKHTRRALLLGVYVGCTLSWTHDWVLAGPEIWRMDFHPDTIWIATWGSRPEAVWAPLSYGAFFGFAIFGWLRYCEGPMRARLGAWRYLVPFPAIFVGNVIVEGSIIEWAQTNRYHQPDNWLLFNIPWLHLVTTGVMVTGILFFTVEALRVLEHFGWRELEPADRPVPVPAEAVLSPAGGQRQVEPGHRPLPAPAPGAAPAPRRVRLALFAVGVALPQAGLTAATMVALYLYDWVGVPMAPA
ncbi:MAG: hypothetical protein AB1679_23980 [Actinomycetota bacterium]|jgi:hypothetical protein